MRTLLERGVSIIFISHKLKEVLEICVEIAVLRGGKVAGHTMPGRATEESLAEMMVGREVLLEVEKSTSKPGVSVLRVENLVVLDDRKLESVKGVSLEVRAGEIVGIAGVQGNGQTELIEAITGLRAVEGGRVWINSQDVTHASPRRVTEAGVAHVPEDRQKNGMVSGFPVKDNLVLQTYYVDPFSSGIVADDQQIEDSAKALVEQYDVRPRNIFSRIGALSGGNQQKVIIAREFSRDCKLLIAAQPTRGLDVGSIEFIHKQIVKMRDRGAGVLLISAELDEILSLSDRVIVMFAGKIMEDMPIQSATRNLCGLLMAGVDPKATTREVSKV